MQIKSVEIDGGSKKGKKIMELLDKMGVDIPDFCKDEKREDKKIARVVPMTQEWRENYAPLKAQRAFCKELEQQLEEAQGKAINLKSRFWTQVEIDLDIYNSEMEYDSEKDEIIIYE